MAVSSVGAVFYGTGTSLGMRPQIRADLQGREGGLLFSIQASIFVSFVDCFAFRIIQNAKYIRWRHAVFRMATTSYFMNANVDFVLITNALANVE